MKFNYQSIKYIRQTRDWGHQTGITSYKINQNKI
jgi:hypothetical protein